MQIAAILHLDSVCGLFTWVSFHDGVTLDSESWTSPGSKRCAAGLWIF